jgi:hypothetical protein
MQPVEGVAAGIARFGFTPAMYSSKDIDMWGNRCGGFELPWSRSKRI